MAYADRNDGGSRIVAIVIVALIHAVIGYAFVTGLAYKYVKQVSEKLNTFDSRLYIFFVRNDSPTKKKQRKR